MSGLCGNWNTTPADNLVNAGWTKWGALADSSVNDARANLEDMRTFVDEVPLSIVETDIELNVPGNLGSPFAKPAVPVRPNLSYVRPPAPVDHGTGYVNPPAQADRPTWDVQRPYFDYSGEPGTLSLDVIDEPPQVIDPESPEEPDYQTPVLPVARDVPVPSFRQMLLPELQITWPADTLESPGMSFDWNETGFGLGTLEAVRADLVRVRGGEMAMPAHIWDALWEREGSRERQAARGAIRQASRISASRGWDMAGGSVSAAVVEVVQGVHNADTERSREMAVREAVMQQEDFWRAVTEGVAAERLMGDLYQGQAERALRGAMFSQEAVTSMYNARVTGFNALLGVIDRKAQVHRELVQKELARLEGLKTELEQARTIGELNEQDIRRYKEQWAAAMHALEVYVAKWDGVGKKIDADRLRLERHGMRLKNREQQIATHKMEWDGFASKMGVNESKARVYETDGRAFAERMRGASIFQEGERTRVQSEVDVARLIHDRTRVDLERYRAEWDGIGKLVQAASTIFDGEARLFAGELQAEGARVEHDNKQYALGLDEAKARENLRVQEAQMNIGQIMRILDMQGRAIEAMYKTQASLGASAMSAVNLVARTGSSYSDSKGCSTVYNAEA